MTQKSDEGERCVLCGELLSAAPTNREHYVPQTLIRGFGNLGIPNSFNWALRENQHNAKSERILTPLSKHYDWATVRVHRQCNQDASRMCVDLKWIITHPGQVPSADAKERICDYYAHLWGLDSKFVDLRVDGGAPDGEATLIYRPGLLNCGRIVIWAEVAPAHDFEHHTIWIGSREGLGHL
jgi:hypothetical protein